MRLTRRSFGRKLLAGREIARLGKTARARHFAWAVRETSISRAAFREKADRRMKKEMLINVQQAEECRIGIVEDGVLEELYIERASQDNYVGNIYKGRIVNLEPSIQAAFVDFGVGRNGFLHISDVESQYFRQGGFDPGDPDSFGGSPRSDIDTGDDAPPDDDDDIDEEGARPQRRDSGRGAGGRSSGERGPGGRSQGGRRGSRFGGRPRVKPPIQDIFRRGDEVLVQVIKEGIGAKGPTLSTYISIPGRYLVLMPALGRVGVSRKIEDEDVRRKLRSTMLELNPPKGLGFIVRTAGQDRTRKDLSRDLAYLLRLWKAIVRRIKNSQGPCTIYEESDMIIRTIRDIFTADIDAIYIDETAAFERSKEFLNLVMPRHVSRLHHYEGREPLFHKYGIEQEIARIHKRIVPLPQGGSIVIDQTEALVAIDVNSGRFRFDESAEESAYQLNVTAAREIARQLRLRDLGGVIVNDFIDMRREKHRRGLERALRDAMRRDRARTKILRTSPFGLIEMTRQRIRPSLKRSVYQECPCGAGALVKTPESMAIEIMRVLMLASHQANVSKITVKCHNDVAAYLNNKKRKDLIRLEDDASISLQILGVDNSYAEYLAIECRDKDDKLIPLPI
jgi:ribonuclease E